MEQIFAGELKDISGTFSAFPTFGALVTVIVRNAFVLAGIISFLLLVFGGFSVIMAAGSGDTKELEKGQKTITYAVLGLILVVVSYWIVQIIEKVSGVRLITP
ncbi:MAG: hypothetical protein Q8L37_04255 [Candidatus Gottesmanbacteria bacterium]|nr:hypothetical protein [Candidatus Gottesmanbacteria bacterium]